MPECKKGLRRAMAFSPVFHHSGAPMLHHPTTPILPRDLYPRHAFRISDLLNFHVFLLAVPTFVLVSLFRFAAVIAASYAGSVVAEVWVPRRLIR